jgi:hypothetical protein
MFRKSVSKSFLFFAYFVGQASPSVESGLSDLEDVLGIGISVCQNLGNELICFIK